MVTVMSSVGGVGIVLYDESEFKKARNYLRKAEAFRGEMALLLPLSLLIPVSDRKGRKTL